MPMEIKITFTDKENTPWAGILLIKKKLDRMDFDGFLNQLPLSVQGSNRGYG